MKSNEQGTQLKITTMFSKKRSRSPTSYENLEKKKTKVSSEDESFDSSPEKCDKPTEVNKNNQHDVADIQTSPTKHDQEIASDEISDDILNISPSSNGDENMNGKKYDINENNNNCEEEIKAEKDPQNERCNICRQFLNNSDILYYQGHPQNAVEEFIALTNDRLVLASGDEGDIMERPQTNITGFSIFDQEGHLVPIDGGLVENDLRIFMSGYLKSICSESADIDEDSIPVKDVGPVIEWFIHGFDGGMKNCITLSTEFGEYNLMKPSPEYTPLMNNLYEKIWISKVTVEYLEEYHYLQPTYEDLLEIIREATIPELDDMKMTEEMLHKHAQFVCDQVVSLEAQDEDDEPLISLPCMRELVKLMGIKFGKRKTRTKIDYKKVDKKAWTKATTTPLVQKTFESFFTNQLDNTDKDLVLRRKRCGVCEPCQLPDCGECTACRAMAKFGGHGRTKKACVRRNCPHMAVQHGDESGPEDEEPAAGPLQQDRDDKIDEAVPVKLTGAGSRRIAWLGEPVKADASKVYYERVEIEGVELRVGEHVMVETSQPRLPALVVRVRYMWRETTSPASGYFHGEVFIRASDTVLGEVGDPREVFLGDRCCHGAPLASVLRRATLERQDLSATHAGTGTEPLDDDGKTYFYQKYYERFTARFEDLPPDPECPNALRRHRYCPSCERKTRRDAKNIPKVMERIESSVAAPGGKSEWRLVRWRDHDYARGGGVLLKPGTFGIRSTTRYHEERPGKLENVDPDLYPEYYRKSDTNLRGSNVDTGEPYCVGLVEAVCAGGGAGGGALVVPQDISLRVRVLYRPEQTGARFPHQEDLNLLYWSEEIRDVPFSAVAGPAAVTHATHLTHAGTHAGTHAWLEEDPCRFYFREAYDRSSGRFSEPPEPARAVGAPPGRGRDKGKGKGKSSRAAETGAGEGQGEGEGRVRPLRTLDVFAGCGGLSAGLQAAGAADTRWAIESVEAAAHAYSLNHRGCTVFHEDCNQLLRAALSGASHSRAGLRLPARGEVELLCGGPPCQGFSGMNRFNSREYSNFKNSLVASYLSYCDYYRPKYFILENVRNFVAFKRGMVLKLTLRTLLALGYQCTFGVVQAGSYGVPQTRRRLIILAAAPGWALPRYPEPVCVFSRRACSLTATVDGKRFVAGLQRADSAPRRTVTIRDAMSDLPQIPNGANKIEIEYASMPESHFQRQVRSKEEGAKLRDHVCKNMAPLIQARIARVPPRAGADWRDLPNVAVALSDGTKCKVLQYRHHDKKNGRSASGALRGVCPCAAGLVCDPTDKQENTLIPWCLPHTGNRHNNWAGLYGRLSWDGYFSTTVTDPEPMGKQGRVLHPEQHRVVSVRECARSQGFPDSYIFAGSVQDKHRQVGNAVPPPLGAALGREIKKALIASNRSF